MTAKRFKKERGTFWDKDKRLNMDETVELLNELHEEKEMWKRKAKWYKESLERKGYKVKCKELEE